MPGISQVEIVLRTLRERIQIGQYAAAEPLPSERSLCRELRVSRTTLRLAIHRLVEEKALVRPPRHRPVVMPEASKIPRVRYVTLWLWPAFEDYGASIIAKGVRKSLHGTGLRLYVPESDHGDWESLIQNEVKFLNAAASDPDAVGMVIWSIGGDRSLKALRRLQAAKKPTVFIDRLPPEPVSADFVGVDNFGASRSMIEWLIGLGHERIAYIANGEDVSPVKERTTGYRSAIEGASISFDPNMVLTFEARGSETAEEAADRLITQVLTLERRPTAIACVNDLVAMHVHDALARAGYLVPDDFSLVGFDGLLRWLPHGGALTTVDQPFERIGETAGRLLLGRILAERTFPPRHILLDAPIRVQKSAQTPSMLPALPPLSNLEPFGW